MRTSRITSSPVLFVLLLACALLLGPTRAHAICVQAGDTQSLLGSLSGALDADSPPVTIKLERGTYVLQSSVAFDDLHPDVRVQGGYVPGTNCDENQRGHDANQTKVLLNNQSYLSLINSAGGLIRLESLSVDSESVEGGQGVLILGEIIQLVAVRFAHQYSPDPVDIGGRSSTHSRPPNAPSCSAAAAARRSAVA